jgi:alkyldihydroxyacetonephosphate synthase
VAVRRWNGWSEEGSTAELSGEARRLLQLEVGAAAADLPADAGLDAVLTAVPESRLTAHPLLSFDPEDRVRHARGQSLPDWIALRAGRLGAVPDAVGRPASDDDVAALLRLAAAASGRVIPYGGGTSVVGGVTPPRDDGDRPTLTIALDRLAGLAALDERSGLATFGAGTLGPDLEGVLAPHGLTLGHFPQSFERSTLGGWVAARSAGQQSLGFGRIEDLFAGGRVVAPAGTLDLPAHPASAAGPDLRQLVLGSEGRLGVLTRATVRAVPRPPREAFPAWFLPDWPRALEGGRDLARSGLPLSMVRVSTPHETQSLLAMAGRSRAGDILGGYLRLRGLGPERTLVIVGASGIERFVEGAVREAGSILRRHGGVAVGGSIGRRWIASRFRSAELRDTVWDAGYALDTLETAADWTRLPDIAATLGRTLRHGLDGIGERVHAFSHLSHLYPDGSSLYVTYVFRRAADPDETLARWRTLKAAASEAIVAGGGTISHQHGIGRDHLPYLTAEKGPLGIAALGDIARRFDPNGIMNAGVLIEDQP